MSFCIVSSSDEISGCARNRSLLCIIPLCLEKGIMGSLLDAGFSEQDLIKSVEDPEHLVDVNNSLQNRNIFL